VRQRASGRLRQALPDSYGRSFQRGIQPDGVRLRRRRGTEAVQHHDVAGRAGLVGFGGTKFGAHPGACGKQGPEQLGLARVHEHAGRPHCGKLEHRLIVLRERVAPQQANFQPACRTRTDRERGLLLGIGRQAEEGAADRRAAKGQRESPNLLPLPVVAHLYENLPDRGILPCALQDDVTQSTVFRITADFEESQGARQRRSLAGAFWNDSARAYEDDFARASAAAPGVIREGEGAIETQSRGAGFGPGDRLIKQSAVGRERRGRRGQCIRPDQHHTVTRRQPPEPGAGQLPGLLDQGMTVDAGRHPGARIEHEYVVTVLRAALADSQVPESGKQQRQREQLQNKGGPLLDAAPPASFRSPARSDPEL
jgi:hypothetical protein